MKSASEIDKGFAEDKPIMANMGEDGVKKFSELLAGAIEFSQHNLFSFSPAMRYVADEWIKVIRISGSPRRARRPHQRRRGKNRRSNQNPSDVIGAALSRAAFSCLWSRPRPRNCAAKPTNRPRQIRDNPRLELRYSRGVSTARKNEIDSWLLFMLHGESVRIAGGTPGHRENRCAGCQTVWIDVAK
jgi:hypothetical protein